VPVGSQGRDRVPIACLHRDELALARRGTVEELLGELLGEEAA